MEPTDAAQGIDALIARLQGEGVEAGRREAERVVALARREAEEIVATARREAEALRRGAHLAVEAERAAGRDAVRLAYRDALVSLKEELTEHVAARLTRLCAQALDDSALLATLLRALLAQIGGEPASESDQHDLQTLAAALGKQALGESVTVAREAGGIHLRSADARISIDLHDATLAALLAPRVAQRFRRHLDSTLPSTPT